MSLSFKEHKVLVLLAQRVDNGTYTWGYQENSDSIWCCRICKLEMSPGSDLDKRVNQHGLSHLKESNLLIFI